MKTNEVKKEADQLTEILKEEAHNYVAINYKNPTEMDFWIIYNAMLISCKITLHNEVENMEKKVKS